MIECPDPVERARILRLPIGIEYFPRAQIGDRVRFHAMADGNLERETAEKAPSHNLLRFKLGPDALVATRGGERLPLGRMPRGR